MEFVCCSSLLFSSPLFVVFVRIPFASFLTGPDSEESRRKIIVNKVWSKHFGEQKSGFLRMKEKERTLRQILNVKGMFESWIFDEFPFVWAKEEKEIEEFMNENYEKLSQWIHKEQKTIITNRKFEYYSKTGKFLAILTQITTKSMQNVRKWVEIAICFQFFAQK